MLSHSFRLSRQITSSRVAAVSCSYLRSNFASGPEFTNEADTFVKAAATLKSKPNRVDQVKAFAESKEAARAIAEKMSGEAINWSKEETKARNNLKRKMMEWARDGVENWELTEMKQIRKESPVMEQLWTDAIVELESELGRDWQGLMHHHSMSDPTYTPRS
ncbi:TPA: hypothetical protein ACH3X2_007616 [Trebouxia sp. C0005]|nr:MAG: hypothetical protein FRX49_12865 [Trebouxia sp. A1-2]